LIYLKLKFHQSTL